MLSNRYHPQGSNPQGPFSLSIILGEIANTKANDTFILVPEDVSHFSANPDGDGL
jgi:hypothetical protein